MRAATSLTWPAGARAQVRVRRRAPGPDAASLRGGCDHGGARNPRSRCSERYARCGRRCCDSPWVQATAPRDECLSLPVPEGRKRGWARLSAQPQVTQPGTGVRDCLTPEPKPAPLSRLATPAGPGPPSAEGAASRPRPFLRSRGSPRWEEAPLSAQRPQACTLPPGKGSRHGLPRPPRARPRGRPRAPPGRAGSPVCPADLCAPGAEGTAGWDLGHGPRTCAPSGPRAPRDSLTVTS